MPNPGSPLLALCQQVFRQTFGAESTVQVIHAGLECGIIGAKYPGLDTVSFGPTIRGAHAPGERVEVASAARCWTLLRSVLQELGRCRVRGFHPSGGGPETAHQLKAAWLCRAQHTPLRPF